MLLSVVIPAFNESAKISKDLYAAREFLSSQPFTSEVILVDDGSSDDTAQMAERLARPLSTAQVQFRVISYPANRGKGYAVAQGVLASSGQIVAFVDAGLCVPLKYLLNGIELIQAGSDLAIASRRRQGTTIVRHQPVYRRLGSKAFWLVVHGLMGVKVSDTQCGFKLFSRASAELLFSRLKTDGFMFDIELLLRAQRSQLKISEFAIEWANDSDSRYHPVWGTLRNFVDLTRIRLRNLYG